MWCVHKVKVFEKNSRMRCICLHIFEHASLRHLLCESECDCREVFSMQTQSSHQSDRSRVKLVRRTIDRDVISSSIDFAISTSLIQGIVRCRNVVFAQTSVLQLTF